MAPARLVDPEIIQMGPTLDIIIILQGDKYILAKINEIRHGHHLSPCGRHPNAFQGRTPGHFKWLPGSGLMILVGCCVLFLALRSSSFVVAGRLPEPNTYSK